MTKQEIFDIVSKHLLTQNRQALDEMGSCSYKTEHGLKCAIGCLFTDEEYAEDFEGNNVFDLHKNNLLPIRFRTEVRFLSELQGIHDEFFPNEWKDELKQIAIDYELEWKE